VEYTAGEEEVAYGGDQVLGVRGASRAADAAGGGDGSFRRRWRCGGFVEGGAELRVRRLDREDVEFSIEYEVDLHCVTVAYVASYAGSGVGSYYHSITVSYR